MNFLSKHLENMLSAAAFAEAGEFTTARDLLDEQRNILLVLHSEAPPSQVWSTTMAMMERLEAGVEILLRTNKNQCPPTMQDFLDDVARSGKHSRLLYRPEISWPKVVSHAGLGTNIICILVDSLENWGLTNKTGKRSTYDWRNRLPCPLIVAGDNHC